jgi:hypothetical protein
MERAKVEVMLADTEPGIVPADMPSWNTAWPLKKAWARGT